MARFYAQLFALPFLLLAVVGTFLGDYGSTSGAGEHHGNLGSIQLQLTWPRDVVDLVVAVALVYVGFLASRHVGRIVVTGLGVALLALAVAGFVAGQGGFAGLRFPAVINVVDLIAGGLGFLAGLGTIEDDAPEPERPSFLRS